MKTILFVTYGGGHVEMQIPLIKKVIKDAEYRPIVIPLTTSKNRLIQEKITYSNLKDYLDISTHKEVISLGTRLANKYHNPYSKMKFQDSAEYLGFICYEYYKENDFNLVCEKYEKYGRSFFEPTNLVEKIINKVNPNILIVTTNVRVEKEFTKVCNYKKIPTVRIHGLFSEDVTESLANYNLVMNKDVKKNLINNGIKSSSIYITGQPFFEQIRKKENTILEEYEMTLFTQYIECADEYVKEFLRYTILYPEKKYGIKFHPSHYSQSLINEVKKYKNVVVSKESSLETIRKSKVIITHFSTCAIEATLLHKPVIIFKFKNQQFPLNLPRYGVGEEITDMMNIDELLNNKRSNNSSFQIQKDNINATSNIINLVREILEAQK